MWKMEKVEFEIDMRFWTRLPSIGVGLFKIELSFQISNKAPPSFPTSNLRPYKHQLTSKSNKPGVQNILRLDLYYLNSFILRFQRIET